MYKSGKGKSPSARAASRPRRNQMTQAERAAKPSYQKKRLTSAMASEFGVSKRGSKTRKAASKKRPRTSSR
jgi:hypothetical protein